MKRAVLGLLLLVGLVIAVVSAAEPRGEGPVQRAVPLAAAPAPVSGSELIVVPGASGEKGQMLTVVDPRQRVVCVYQIDAVGWITLKSVRNIQWDLQILELNNEKPLPQELRALLEPR